MVRLVVYLLQVVNPEIDSHSMGGRYWIINVQYPMLATSSWFKNKVLVSKKTPSLNLDPEGPSQLYNVVLAGSQEYALARQSLTSIVWLSSLDFHCLIAFGCLLCQLHCGQNRTHWYFNECVTKATSKKHLWLNYVNKMNMWRTPRIYYFCLVSSAR